MKFLKYFLLAILFFIAVWGTSLLAGPKIIILLSQYYYGDYIRLHKVEISPRLEVTVQRIHFAGPENIELSSANAMSLKINWPTLLKAPKAKLSFAQINLGNQIKLDNVEFHFIFDSFQNYHLPVFEYSAETAEIPELVKLSSVTGDGIIDLNRLEINKISFWVDTVHSPNGDIFSAYSVAGIVDTVKLREPIFNQSNNLSILAERFEIEDSFITSSINSEIRNRNGEFSLNTKFKQALLSAVNTSVQEIDFINFISTNANGFSFEPSSVLLSGVDFVDWNAKLRNLKLEFVQKGDVFSVDLKGVSENLHLSAGSLYVGDIPPVDIDGNVDFQPASGSFETLGALSFQIKNKDFTKLSANTEFSITHTKPILECLLSVCETTKIVVSYSVNDLNSSLTGLTTCHNQDCYGKNFNHTVKVERIAPFFDKLRETKFFNPLFLTYAYSFFLRGKRLDDGMQIEF